MSNVLILNATPQETRVAVIENGVISDFYLERRRRRGVVGNIYKGRVTRVLPGMQAAFVDIGLEKAAFLYVADVFDDHSPLELGGDGDDDDEEEGRPRSSRSRKRRGAGPIEDQLREGQEILVQVAKDPIGTKGARATSHVSLAGRYLVFMPTVDHLGISRQIGTERERRRLRDIAEEMRPPGGGFVVRTASEGVPSEYLRQDMRLLINQWNEILRRRDRARTPSRLFEDLDLVLRAARDLATAELDSIVLDSREEYERVMNFMDAVMPQFASRVELYVGRDPIFDAYGIERELDRALQRRVDLPSGGYLVIDRSEALTSIDVNTGKFVGSRNLEETIAQTNIEAAAEIAYQLRLRSIGGLIVLDFIDMEDESNRKRVQHALEQALAGDKGRVKITKISEFGLVEMTRKRTRESIDQMLCQPCVHCEGVGRVRSRETIAYDLLRGLRRELPSVPEFEVHVFASPAITQLLQEEERDTLHELELRFNKKIRLRPDGSREPGDFRFVGMSARESRSSGRGASAIRTVGTREPGASAATPGDASPPPPAPTPVPPPELSPEEAALEEAQERAEAAMAALERGEPLPDGASPGGPATADSGESTGDATASGSAPDSAPSPRDEESGDSPGPAPSSDSLAPAAG